MPNYRIVVEVDPSRATRGSRDVENSLDRVERRAQSVGVALTRAFAILGIGGGLIGTIGLLKDFEQEMSTVKGVTGATEAQFRSLREEAQRLGATTRFSATQAAEGMTFLARAGFDTNEVLGATEGTLRLAQAGALDLGRAADIASNILTGFRLEVAETGRVVDVLAASANMSNTDVEQLGEAMKFVAPVASGLGVEIETATAAIGALSDAGLQASLAGTGLRRVLSELESPSKKTRDILAAVGLTADDVKISQVGLVEALTKLRDAGVDVGTALEIFGDRGGPAFEVLSSSIPKIQGAEVALRSADGTAQRLADTMDDNLNGSILATKSAAEGLILAFGESGATGSLRGFFDLLTTVLRAGVENIGLLINAITALTIVVGSRLVAAAAAGAAGLVANAVATARATVAANSLAIAQARMGAAFGPPTAAMIAQTAAAGRLAAAQAGLAAAGRGLLALFGGPLGLAIAAVTTALFYLWSEADKASDILGGLETSSREAVNELLDLEQKAREAGINVDTLGNAASDTNPLIRTIAAAYGSAADQAQRLAINARQAAIEVARGKIKELEGQRNTLLRPITNNSGANGLIPQFFSGVDQYGQQLFGGPSVEERIAGGRELAAQIDLQRRQVALLEQIPDSAFAPPAPPDVSDIPEAPDLSNLSGGGRDGKGGRGGGRSDSEILAEFNARLLDDIELAGLSGAAHQKRSAILDVEAQLGRKLNDTERTTIEQRLDLLAAAQDLAILTEYSDNMQKEVELLGLSNREREVAAEVMRIEDQLKRDLTDSERELVEARARELQQARDADVLRQFAENLEAENAALADLLPGREARAAIMQKELELGRELDPLERARITNLVDENIALRDQREIYDGLNKRREEAIRQLQAIAALQADGKLSDADARLATAGIGLAGDLQSQAGELGGDFAFQAQLDQLQLWTDEQNRIVADGLAARLISEEEAAARSVAIEEERQRRLRDLYVSQQLVAVQSAQSIAESLTSIAKDAAGEQSTIYRGMFIASKAFAIAESLIKIQQGIANAMSLPFPANLAAAATVAAQAASIVSNIRSISLQLAEGGLVRGPGTGTSDSIPAMLSNGEYVVNARAAGPNLGLLEAINSGRDPRGAMKGNGQTIRSEGRQAPAPQVNVTAAPAKVTVVNVDDPRKALAALDTAEGDQLVMNILERNRSSARQLLGAN